MNRIELRENRETWQEVNSQVLDEETRSVFCNRKRAVDYYIDGLELGKIVDITGLSKSEILRFVKKCMERDKNGKSLGYEILIPYRRGKKTNGKQEQLFCLHPELKAFIVGNYFGDKHYTLEHGMNIRTLHSKYLEECKRIGIMEYEYPFTLKDRGYANLRRFVNELKEEESDKDITRKDKNAIQKYFSTGEGESNNLNPIFPYNVVQIDGHKIDILYSVETVNENGEIILMPATRCWLLAVIDVATRAIIGYSMSQHENYNQSDVLAAVYNSIVPHKKMEFTHKSFSYPENGGFPSLAIPETEWGAFDMIMLDNAKSHLAKNTLYRLTDQIKCTVNYGSVATPETRGIVERFFKTLENQGFHRLPGTTGSSTYDTKRKNPEDESVKYKITYEDICEIVEYLISQYNNSAHASLENETPLQVMERRVVKAGLTPYTLSRQERVNIEKLTFLLDERFVRGNKDTGVKPYISYKGVRYHADEHPLSFKLIGKRVSLEINPNDLSHIKIYDEEGVFIANLVATGEWGRYPHSLKTRLEALKRSNNNRIENTPFTPHLTEYENELRENSKKSRRSRTKAAIIRKEMGKDIQQQPAETIELSETRMGSRGKNKTDKNDSFSKEQLEELNNLSIEEAYERGLLG